VLVPPHVRRAGGTHVRVTRATDYDALDTWTRYGSAFADTTRAVVDAARGLPDHRTVRGVVLGAVGRGAATPADLRSVLDSGQRNGSALTRRAVVDAERGCASPPEAELVDALVGRGVPFYVNPELWLGPVLLGRPDVWLVGRGVAGEVESRERHDGEDQTESTYDRHERFTAAGVSVTHLSVRRIRADVAGTAANLLSRPSVRQPPDLRVVPRGPLLR
jgi:hypothetical protein